MIDDNMTNILKNFAGAGQENPVIINAAVEKDAMKILLEGLDSQQKSVNRMPAQHKMAKNTKTKHPASKYLVGGEFDDEVDLEEGDLVTTWADVQKNKKKSKQSFEPATTECPSCQGNGFTHSGEECSRCDGVGELHEGAVEEQLSPKLAPKQAMNQKQSFADIFKSMDEEHENMETRFKRELHDEITNKELTKGDNGKSNLSESSRMLSIQELMAQIKNLAYFGGNIDEVDEEFRTNDGETFIAFANKVISAVEAVRSSTKNTVQQYRDKGFK